MATSEDLDRGKYGTLAQLEAAHTPLVAMFASRGDEYVVENLFQGYPDRRVPDQTLFDSTNVVVRDNFSDRRDLRSDRAERERARGRVLHGYQ